MMVLSRKKMVEEGYPIKTLKEISANPDLTHLFFRTGTGRTSNVYYFVEKVDRWLEMREDEKFENERRYK